MRRANIGNPEFRHSDTDPEGFDSGMYRMGPMVGASILGATVYELAPGKSICPYHYEYGEEEWLLVLEGHPVIRHPGAGAARPLRRRGLPGGAGGRAQ